MESGIVESCGKLDRIAAPGLVFLVWPIEQIRARVSLKIRQLQVSCETKTKDNVFVTVVVAGIYYYFYYYISLFLYFLNIIYIN
jgi:regulator of protease activity HflC (stomatin/prohibitin superfamily)